jgi:hypothetical protein
MNRAPPPVVCAVIAISAKASTLEAAKLMLKVTTKVTSVLPNTSLMELRPYPD